jgi:hypothetical protein
MLNQCVDGVVPRSSLSRGEQELNHSSHHDVLYRKLFQLATVTACTDEHAHGANEANSRSQHLKAFLTFDQSNVQRNSRLFEAEHQLPNSAAHVCWLEQRNDDGGGWACVGRWRRR